MTAASQTLLVLPAGIPWALAAVLALLDGRTPVGRPARCGGPRGELRLARVAGLRGGPRGIGRRGRGRLAGGSRDLAEGRSSGRDVRPGLRGGGPGLFALRGHPGGALARLPGAGAARGRRPERAVPHRGRVQLLRVLRDLHDRLFHPDQLPGEGLPGEGRLHLRRGQPAGLGDLPDRDRVALQSSPAAWTCRPSPKGRTCWSPAR